MVSGQSLIGASLPCEERDIDPDPSNTMDNLICPFTNETCITTSQLCDCVNATMFISWISGSGSGSGSILDPLPGDYDEVFGIHSIDCSKLFDILPCTYLMVKFPSWRIAGWTPTDTSKRKKVMVLAGQRVESIVGVESCE